MRASSPPAASAVPQPQPAPTAPNTLSAQSADAASISAQPAPSPSAAMGQNEKMWSQDCRVSKLESPPPLLSALQSGQSDIAPIYKFVLTGGPCAGKTTSLDRLSTYFRDLKETDILNFQWQILKLQMSLEDSFYSLAQDSGKPCVILCDRGVMDGSAYMTPEQWEELKAQHDLDTVTLRDTRYIAIFHLVTAAEGAEKFYSLDSNGIRIESIEQAREIDARTCRAWIGHPKLYVFDNSTGFEGKMQRLVDTAAGLCGIPTTLKASRKFLLASPPTSIPFHHEDFEVEKVYLTPESAETSKDYSFVRCRSQYGIPAYGMTTVRYLQTGDAVHLKRILSAREYSYAVRHRNDQTRDVIKQQRMCFLYNNQSFQIHVYKEPASMAGLAILHVQASGDNSADTISLPSFLNIEREVSGSDESFSAYNVSLKDSAIASTGSSGSS
ncbi:Isoform b, partial [Globisporangium splendens]